MNLQNKKFQNIENQEIVFIVGDNGVFYNLSNGANIKKDIFFQKYTEMIDPTSFFEKQSAAGLAELAEKIKNVDSSKAVDGDFIPQVKYKKDTINENLQYPNNTDPLMYKEMLIKKYENEKRDLSQYKVYDDDDEAAADFERKNIPQIEQKQRNNQKYQDNKKYENEEYLNSENYSEMKNESVENKIDNNTKIYTSPEEESFRFFKSFKKIYPIKLTIDFDERIADPNFIKMMAINYEGDIIKFYTKEFMNRIYNDPGFLENKIYGKLKSLIFKEKDIEKKPRIRKPKQVEIKSNLKKRTYRKKSDLEKETD